MTPEHEQAANARTALEAAAMSIGFPAAIDELTTRAAELQQWLDNNTPQWLAVEPTEPTMLDVLRQLFEAAAGDVRVRAWLDTATLRLKESRDVPPIRQMPPDLTEVREANVSLLHHLSTFVSHRPEISKWLSEVAAGVRTNTSWPMLAANEPAAPPAQVSVVISDSGVNGVPDAVAVYADARDAGRHCSNIGGHAYFAQVVDADPSELEEARSWARHGYEIAQRSGTWSDTGVAPAWLTDGWEPGALEGTDPTAVAGELPSAELPLWQVNTRHELEPPRAVPVLRSANGWLLSKSYSPDDSLATVWRWIAPDGHIGKPQRWADAMIDSQLEIELPLREVRENS